MILCDIGNTSYHFLQNQNSYREDAKSFNPEEVKEKVYFICVNAEIKKRLLLLENWIDLAPFIDMNSYYATMGIDRIFAVEAIENGIIIDAGSAITVDLVKDSAFMGGFIYPGIKAMQNAYTNISPALAYSFNFDVELDIMPKNSQDAISYGFVKTLYAEVISYNMPIFLTGGDALAFKKVFKDAKVDEELIFGAMKKIIKKAKLC